MFERYLAFLEDLLGDLLLDLLRGGADLYLADRVLLFVDLPII